MPEVTLGGDRLGSGNKMKQYLHNYERSTHDTGFIWRSTMAAGTLVPFLCELALPGDTFDIDLDCNILTHPTIGPLFGTYKIQMDVFQIPIRLYQAALHMNMLGIGLNMADVKLPVMKVNSPVLDLNKPIDNQQINPSCLLKYLGVSGCGHSELATHRFFNAIPLLAYWDIYKNYYANKQEEKGVVIHKVLSTGLGTITDIVIYTAYGNVGIPSVQDDPVTISVDETAYVIITFGTYDAGFDPSTVKLIAAINKTLDQVFSKWVYDENNNRVIGSIPYDRISLASVTHYEYTNDSPGVILDAEPHLTTFDLSNIDDMRMSILQHDMATRFEIDNTTPAPYGLMFEQATLDSVPYYCQQFPQEGLACKTYQSDLFNNWISTEWLDGAGGINEITAISTAGDSFTVNKLLLSKKIYDMLMRIAVSGGSYDDWLDAVYTHDRQRSAENPIYIGGMIKNLVFQEVISQSATAEQPLGTLAGRGKLGSKDKGGHIVAKVDEPSYIMAIISLTPNIDYSQGNKWDMSLETLDDLHKPGLDGIGFQELLTDQMAWWDTACAAGAIETKSAGKQPAWLNYMTNVNVVKGNFADESQQMFMVLNRQYEPTFTDGAPSIADLTTYIDPSKFNHIFADTRRDAQNFWAQIAIDIKARRKMSAKQIPNL